jgi:predicted phosphoribosyltransferase
MTFLDRQEAGRRLTGALQRFRSEEAMSGLPRDREE